MARPGPKEARHRWLPDVVVSVAGGFRQVGLTHEYVHDFVWSINGLYVSQC